MPNGGRLIAGAILGALLASARVVGAPAAEPPPSPPPSPTPPSPASTAVAPATAPSNPPLSVSPQRTGGQIRGAVSYGRHEPAVGAIVVVRPEGAATPIYVASTGTNGAFAFDGVADGTYRATVRRDGYVPVVKEGIGVRAPFRAVVEVLLQRGTSPADAGAAADGTASLAGHIRIGGGGPIAEVRVRLVRADAGDDPKTTMTDGSGAFNVAGLRAGRWRLELAGAGLLPVRTEVDLAGDVALEAALARQPADYQPLPADLIVPEDVIPPKSVAK